MYSKDYTEYAEKLRIILMKEPKLMDRAEKEQLSPQNISIPVDWHIADSLKSQYASNVFVQAGEYEIIISFFQTQLPLLTGTPEENVKKLEQLGSVQAECVGRMIVHPDLVPKIISALQTTLDNYLALKEQINEGISR